MIMKKDIRYTFLFKLHSSVCFSPSSGGSSSPYFATRLSHLQVRNWLTLSTPRKEKEKEQRGSTVLLRNWHGTCLYDCCLFYITENLAMWKHTRKLRNGLPWTLLKQV